MNLDVSTLMRRPLKSGELTFAGFLVVATGAAYCWLLSVVVERHWNPTYILWWSATMVGPWLAAFEANKRILHRVRSLPGRLAAIAGVVSATVFLSALMQLGLYAAYGVESVLSWRVILSLHVLNHVSETLIIILLTVMSAYMVNAHEKAAATRSGQDKVESGLLDHVLWVRAAGNYVELRTHARVVMRRMTLTQIQDMADPARFVRISRSVIVNIGSVETVDGAMVRTLDGAEHRIGGAFRAEAARLTGVKGR